MRRAAFKFLSPFQSCQTALAAVHESLRFQIEDHQTGDSTEIESGRQ
ncbi:MAG: hypothetical protein M3525_00295 [Acidobacteriota bacterium]|nr:hypothetical protein [Acidobacteriota bacterium]